MPSFSEFCKSHGIHLHPFFVNRQVYFAAGLWYWKPRSFWKSAFYSFYRSFVFILVTATAVDQILDVYLLVKTENLRQLAKDSCSITVTMMVFIKIYLMGMRTHKIEELEQDMMRVRFSRTNPDDEMIWNRASNMIHTMTKIFYILGGPCVFCWIFFPTLDQTAKRMVPYPVVYPVDPYESPHFEIIYFFQSVALFPFLFGIISVDLSYCSYVIVIIAQLELLGSDIRKIGTDSPLSGNGENVSREQEALKRAVIFHNEILRQLKKIHEIHHDIFCVQMSLTAVELAFRDCGYNFGSILFDAWVQCYWGSQLQEKVIPVKRRPQMQFSTDFFHFQGYDLVKDIYDSQWVDMDNKMKKMFMFMMVNAQRVPKLKNGILIFALPLYQDVSLIYTPYMHPG
ncbi:UNVERIFIED_CONTAM: hypothetical protein PYX00_003964 [Menopon gallinae]|uniref:Odorant receptor n=1 Tax=Menopon gallinae TaxID=328185 RepID=A0AAW2I2X4_9NEOP